MNLGKDLDTVIKRLENGTALHLSVLTFFLKINQNKCYLFFNGYKYQID